MGVWKYRRKQIEKSNKNHIVFLIYSLSGGGAERVTCHMANYWADNGKQVTVVTYATSSSKGYRLSPKVNLIVLGIDKASHGQIDAIKNNLRRLRFVRKCMAQLSPDVVISMMAGSNALLAMSCFGLGICLIGSERNYPGDDDTNSIWSFLRKFSYRYLHCVVVQTEEGARWLRENTNIRQCVSIPNPLVFPLPVGKPVKSPEMYRDHKLVLGVGRLAGQKQFDHLIRCFAQVSKECSDWRLLILGEGELKKELQELIDQLRLSERVKLLGRVGNIGDWYKAADVFAMSSRTEGFPNALIEAMAHGVAVLSYDCKTGPGEIIDSGKNGLLVTDGDENEFGGKLLDLMGDSKLRLRLSLEAQEIKEHLEISKVMQRWEELLKS